MRAVVHITQQVYNQTYKELVKLVNRWGEDTNVPENDTGVEEVCDTLGNLYKSMINLWIGAAIVTLAQIVIVA